MITHHSLNFPLTLFSRFFWTKARKTVPFLREMEGKKLFSHLCHWSCCKWMLSNCWFEVCKSEQTSTQLHSATFWLSWLCGLLTHCYQQTYCLSYVYSISFTLSSPLSQVCSLPLPYTGAALLIDSFSLFVIPERDVANFTLCTS